MTKVWKFAVVAALVAAFGALAAVGLGLPGEVAVPRDYQCDVYVEHGCARMVIASGGELEVQSGGMLDLQAGSVMTVGSALNLTDTLDMNNSIITNIGNAGTDFSGDGGLATAGGITVATGGVVVTEGGITVTVGGITVTAGNLIVSDDISVTAGITVGGAITTSGLTLDSVRFSGPLTFGGASGVVSGTPVAHGLGALPTSILVSASGIVTAHPMVAISDTTNFTICFLTDEDPPAMTVYWIAGK